MLIHQRKIFIIMVVLSIALLGSGVIIPSAQAQAQTNLSASVAPNMQVTLMSGGSTYASTVYAGNSLIFRAGVKNTGNVPLQVTANLAVPQGWDVDQDKYSDCPENLAIQSTCTITWYFTPQAVGQVFLRVYARGGYTTSTGASNRITQSPAFIFNVQPPKQDQGGNAGTNPVTTPSVTTPGAVSPNTGINPSMKVTLMSSGSTYSATVYAAKGLTFQAQVANTGNIPLRITANLTVPQGWDVDEDKFSDCPEELAVNKTCMITWKFTPQASGQVILRVFVRGFYGDASISTNRITQSPAFIFNVKPPKVSQ
jgi:hypothetical protein